MAIGTWNQGELEKRVTKIDLENYSTIEFRDSSLTSDGIFDIVEFPYRLTAGKNLIKLRANDNDILVKNSKIHIEILDSNGNPIYYEPLNYLEHDGTRVVAIYIFPDKTAPGIGTVYIAGRTKIDLNTNVEIPFSRDYGDPNYLNVPNVLWSRNVSIAPENSKNTTEIIFTQPFPKAIVKERVNKYFQPINLSDVEVDKNGTGTVTIKAIPSTTRAHRNTLPVSQRPTYEGAATPRSPMRSVGRQRVIKPKVKEFKRSSNDVATNKKGQPVEVESAEIVTVSTFSRLETTGFPLSASMEGGTIIIVNPDVDILQGNTALNPDNHVVPYSQFLQGDASVTTPYQLTDTAFKLSGSYEFVIDKVLSSTKANVIQTSGFKNAEENTFGAFSFTSFGAQTTTYEIKDINATSNFTCSFVEPFVLSQTEQSQSFAEIVLSNIEPATGDVHKIQTLYKPSGQFGDFIDAGTVEVEQVEIFEDVTSFESIQSIGMVYNRIGFFTNLTDFNTYWETINGSVTPEVALTAAFKPDILLDGIELTPDTTFDSTSNQFGYLHLKSEYHPKIFTNTGYVLSFNATADDSTYSSSDTNIEYSRLDVFISGSKGSIQSDMEFNSRYQTSVLDIPEDEFNLGTRIATIELTPGNAYDETPVFTYFKALKEEIVDVYFVIRRGKWTLSKISLKSDKQTGFSPNYTRINTRIPSEFLETPLTFKFLYFDIHNNKAQAETTVFPVTFLGDNVIISGPSNQISGSVYIGNSVGSGIELAGVNSGFIRSIGYEGFQSASRTDQPGGFMLYTGSVLPDAPDNYAGVGIEIVQDSSSFLKFDTTDGLDIRAKKFFIGTDATQFISGSGGNIEISSSLFHLDPANDSLIIGAGTTINADLSVNSLFTPAGKDASNATAYISSSGESKFVGDGAGNYAVNFSANGATIAGFGVSPAAISSSNNNLIFKDSGEITASSVLLGNKAGGNFLQFAGSTLTVQGSITADNISTPSTAATPSSSITADGLATFRSASIAGFEVNTEEIKSSNNNLRLKSSGQISASTVLLDGGTVGGWNIDENTIFSNAAGPDRLYITTDAKDSISAGNHESKSVITMYNTSSLIMVNMGNIFKNKTNTGIAVFDNWNTNSKIFEVSAHDSTGTLTAQIAGWNFNTTKLFNTGVHLSASYGLKVFDGTDDNNDFVEMKYKASDDFGIKGVSAGETIFQLGSANQIAGWTFTEEKLQGQKMIIRSNGTIESDGFASNDPGSGFRLTAAQGGFLEVENARIRGTLSTAVFEKETVNAVGGQLYVANSSVLTASVIAPGGVHSATQTTMSIANVSGFTQGEVLSAKKVSQTGFATEYIFVESASRNDASSETDLSGLLFVIRGYSGSAPGDTGSLGDLASNAQAYSGSQVIISTGKIGTGFVRINANPNDPTTPYIDIVERTGSAIYDTDLKARIGDLSGITDSSFTDDVTGFGLYTRNGYFKGKLEITDPVGDSMLESFGGVSGSIIASTKLVPDGEISGSQWYQTATTRHQVKNGVLMMSSSNNSQWNGELRSKQRFHRSGDHSLVFDVVPKDITGDQSAPRFMVGWGAVPSASTVQYPTNTFQNTAHALYFSNNDITVYHGGTSMGTVAADSLEVGEKYRCIITPFNNSSKSARYQVFKYPNLTGSIGDVEFAGRGHTPDDLDVSITCLKNTRTLDVCNIQVTAPGQKTTVIDGSSVTTGKIRSTNYGASVGSIFDLDNGTFQLGGSSSPKLEWDGSTLSVVGQITIEAGSTTAVDFGAGAAASASDAQSTADTANTAAGAAQSTADANALTAFNQWVTASLDQLRTTGEFNINGGTVSDDRGMFTTPSYWGNKPLVQIFDTGPISDGWVGSTTLAAAGTSAADLYTFTSTETISGSIRIHAKDAEGGVRLVINSGSAYQTPEMILNDNQTSLHPHGLTSTAPIFVNQSSSISHLTGSNWELSANITNFGDTSGGSSTGENTDGMWEYRIPIQSGSNTIRFYAISSDGGSVRRISVFKDGTIGQTGIDTAQATGELGVSNAALAQNAIDEMESQLVLTPTGMDISSSGQSPNFGLARFGTTTEFFDGSSAQNTKLRLNSTGVRAFGDDANTYADITSAGLDIVEDGDNVANFGSTVRVGPSATNKSALRVDASGNVTIGTSNTTNVTINADGTALFTGGVTASGGEIGGFEIATSQINSTNDNLILKDSGQITGSAVKFTGGTVAGWTINTRSIGSGSSEGQGDSRQRVSFNNRSIAGANTYQSSETLATGLHIQTHQSGNASSLIVGEIISDADGNHVHSGDTAFNKWYGIQATKWNNTQPFFQLAFKATGTTFTTKNSIAGWDFDTTKLSNGTDIQLDAANKKITINDQTFGNTGIQLDHNSGTPRFFAGKSNGGFFKFDGTTTEISSSNFSVNTAGSMTASNADFDGFAIARSLRQKAVVINQSNMHQYLIQIVKTDESDAEVDSGASVDFVLSTTSRLVLDGSLGGEIVSHVILDVDLSIIDPSSGFVSSGYLVCMANGTTPTGTFQQIAINVDGTSNQGSVSPSSNAHGPFGPIREIVSPPTTGNAKVPVTIEVKDGKNVEFYVPIGPAAQSSPFGKMQGQIDAIQMASNTFIGTKVV